MADFTYQFKSIQGGIQSSFNDSQENEYWYGLSIDPEAVITGINSLGNIKPIAGLDFSNKISSAPTFIISPGRDTNVYVVSYNGQVTKFDRLVSTETVLSSSIGNTTGNGAAYYNNYLYFATSADIHRYGPLDSSPTSQLSAWTAATSAGQPILSAVCNYPQIGQTVPNHPMHVHVDNKLYFADYISAVGRGKAVVNWISSNGDGSVMGGSRGALDIPFGYTITDIETFGNDLAILAIPIADYSNALMKTGRASLFLWDTFSSSFYRQVDISDSIATAMVNHNGELRIFSSTVGQRYHRILGYTGGNSFRELNYVYGSKPPPSTGVDTLGGTLAYASDTNIGNPQNAPVVMTLGTANARINPTARHHIMSTQKTDTSQFITALSFIDYQSKYPWIGSVGNTSTVMTSQSGTNLTDRGAYFVTKPIMIGQEFEITKIRLCFDNAITSNDTFIVQLYTDNFSDNHSTVQYGIGSTGPAAYLGKKIIDLGVAVRGQLSFAVYVSIKGTTGTGINLPITVWGRTLRDD